MDERVGPSAVEAMVSACMHPLYEVDRGITRITVNPEKSGKKVPVIEAFEKMGSAFRHLLAKEHKWLENNVQEEVDRRWNRLKAMAENELL